MNRIAYYTGYMDKRSFLRKTIEQEGLIVDKKEGDDEETSEEGVGVSEVPEDECTDSQAV